MTMQERQFGLRQDRPDERDWRWPEEGSTGRVAGVAGSVNFLPWCPPVLDQGGTQACAAFAGTLALYLRSCLIGKAIQYPSVLGAYYAMRVQRAAPEHLLDTGGYPRDLWRGLSQHGLFAESRFPFAANSPSTIPPWDCWQHAIDARVEGYYRVSGSEHIKYALRCGYPVFFGMQVDEEYTYNYRGGVYEGLNGHSLGGHAQVIVGYRQAEGAFIVRNSWGRSWGQDGNSLISESFMNSDASFDQYVVTLAPGRVT